MSDNYRITNFLTGKDEELPKPTGEPTEAWVRGWNAGMGELNSDPYNPYSESTLEYRDWEDGFGAAEED